MNTSIENITISRTGELISFPVAPIISAISSANDSFIRYSEVNQNLDLFSILGMRNLSAFVGEVYVASLARESDGMLMKNPHQDGYPDLLLLDEYGSNCLSRINDVQEKAPFSPFAGGGIEVKATCGAVPTPAICRRRGFAKPEVGDSRIHVLTGYDWKAHHRETNNLIGLLWNFNQRIPEIVALFYSSNLTTDDWGAIVQPTEGGGRTTSVSIMTRPGVKKMALGCLYCKNDTNVISVINRINGVNISSIVN